MTVSGKTVFFFIDLLLAEKKNAMYQLLRLKKIEDLKFKHVYFFKET